jgi:formate dehydrogenase subunit gamma
VNITPPLVTRPGIVRYTWGQRTNHWLTALSFLLLAASGLAFFHPAFFPLVHLFGSPQWARILHPWIGVFMFCSFLILAIRMWSYNLWAPNDTQWMKQLDDEVMNRDELMPPIGKYNPGQKLLFFVMVASMGLLLLTGLVIWRSVIGVWIPWPIWLYRSAVLLHAFTAFVLIFGIIVHIYAALWVKGSIRAMVRGSVTGAWARHHHPGWYREMTGRSPTHDLPPRERPL